jgi:hypothetical protein
VVGLVLCSCANIRSTTFPKTLTAFLLPRFHLAFLFPFAVHASQITSVYSASLLRAPCYYFVVL